MDFAFSEEQELLRAAARDYLADRWPLERVIAAADADPQVDVATWRELAELGWLDTRADSGLGVLEHAVLAEESAFALLPAPWFSTVALAGPLLDDELRDAVAAGERSVTLASAPVSSSGGTLTGRVALVPDLATVTDAIVRSDDGLYVVDLAAHPETVHSSSTMDRTRRLGELRLDATPARRLGTGTSAIPGARRHALALAACEAVGVAQRALDLAGEHAKSRQQFGRFIGTYQGVSHRVADIFVTLQLDRSLAYWAAWAVSEGDSRQDVATAAAKTAAAEGAVSACENAIQVHGGIGFTWEHPLHRFYKRAQWLDAFEGYGRVHRAAVAAAVLDQDDEGGAAA